MRFEFENIAHQNNEEHQTELFLWEQSRMSFLRNVFLGSIVIASPWVTLCDINAYKVFDDKGIFTDTELELIKTLQNSLFSNVGNGPSAVVVNVHNYSCENRLFCVELVVI
jgi:hypothetical protein